RPAMAEVLTLSAPIVPPSRTTYQVTRLVLDLNAKVIQAWLLGSDGVELDVEWNGAQAVTLMTALNTANLSTVSLVKRVLQQAVTDGLLPAGTVSGTPGVTVTPLS